MTGETGKSKFLVCFSFFLRKIRYFFNYARVDITEDGLKALVHLASGDMRKALNILQVKVIFN